MAGPWEKYAQPQGGPVGIQLGGADPMLPSQVDRAESEAALARLRIEQQRLENEKLAREANEKKTQDEKISELRQRDANLRNAANQLVTTEQSYDTSLRGGWPNFISGWLPSPETGAFNKNAAALLDAGQAAFRIPGSGDQSAPELQFKLDAYKPSPTATDKENDANFSYLRKRIDTERKALELEPIDWGALSSTADVALPPKVQPNFLPDLPTGVSRGTPTVDPSGASSYPSELAEKFTQEAQTAFNNGASRAELDAIAKKYGAPGFGEDLDKALGVRDRGGRASFLVPDDVQEGPGPFSGWSDNPVGAAGVAAGNMSFGGRLDEAVGATGGNADAAQAGKEYLRDKYPVASFAGDVIGGIPLALGGTRLLTQLGMNAPRAALATDAATGAYFGSGENNQNRAMGAVIGAGAGTLGNIAGNKALGMFGRTVSPSGGAAKPLYEAGVRPTIGQRFADKPIIGPALNNFEQAIQSLPIVGSLPANARSAARDQFETGGFNRSLKEIGDQLPQDVRHGPEAFTYAREAFDRTYDRARSGMQFAPDSQYTQDFGNFQRQWINGGLLDSEGVKQVDKVISTRVGSRLRNGQLTGDSYKKAVSDLNAAINNAGKPEVKQALKDYRSILDATARRNSDPEAVALMDAADKGYAQYKPLTKATAMAGNETGRFTPSNLESVHRRDMGKTAAYREGNTLMSDYVNAGRNLKDTLPNSGTGERLQTGQLLGGATLGGATWLDPSGVLPASMAATALPYAPGVRNLIGKAVAPRETPWLKNTGDMIYNHRVLGRMFAAPLLISSGAGIGQK